MSRIRAKFCVLLVSYCNNILKLVLMFVCSLFHIVIAKCCVLMLILFYFILYRSHCDMLKLHLKKKYYFVFSTNCCFFIFGNIFVTLKFFKKFLFKSFD